jgi:hypothetical protein
MDAEVRHASLPAIALTRAEGGIVRPSSWLSSVIVAWGLALSAGMVQAAPFDDKPKLLLHVMTTTTKNACARGLLSDCTAAETQGDLYPGSTHFVYLLVAKGELPHISGAQWGITYQGGNPGGRLDSAGIDLFSWTTCGTLEFPSANWPAPNSGNMVTYASGSCPSGETGVIGYFYMAAYAADTLSVIPRPVDGAAKVAVCPPADPGRHAAETVLTLADLGRAVFSSGAASPGCNPCVEECGGSHPTRPREVAIAHPLDSGMLSNPTGSPAVVFDQVVHTPDAAWCRAYFSTVQLAPGSLLRVSSLKDGQTHDLDRFTAPMWGLGSAYLNGDSVRVQVVAAPNSTGYRVVLDHVGVELKTEAACTNGPCGACMPDGRFPSNEDWSARWVQGGCSASIYNANGCFVSAGHCWTPIGTIFSFRNPLSLNDCTVQQPPVVEQFPVTMTVGSNTGCTTDWRTGKIGVNSQGETHFQRYGVFKPIATVAPVVNATADIFAFGSSSVPVVNGVQQHTVETVNSVTATGVTYSGGTTTGGTSGGGIIQNDAIIGINTCCSGPCKGLGTRVTEPAFLAARQAMCPHTVHAPWDKPFCKTDTEVIVPITVCNTSGFPDSYTMSFTGVAPGPQCSVQGPTTFQILGSNPVGPVPPNDCVTVNVKIQRPVGLTAAFLTSCYDVTATSTTTLRAITDRGSVQDRRDLCFGNPPAPNDPIGVAFRVAQVLSFNLRNDTVASGLINYRVEAMAPNMEPSGAIALDGNYEGVPAQGTVMIPLNGTGTIDVGIFYRWLEPFDLSDLIISTDTDGNGQYEPVGSVALRSLAVPQSGVVTPPTPKRPLILHPALPNPTRGNAAVAFRIDTAARVVISVFDIAGRLIQTVHDGQLAAGDHVLHWDGRNRFGQDVRTGTYIVRVSGLGYQESNKVVLLR